jgi:hypothetical protein
MPIKMKYDKLKHIGNILTPALDYKPKKSDIGWTKGGSYPLKQFSKDEIDNWIKSNPDRLTFKKPPSIHDEACRGSLDAKRTTPKRSRKSSLNNLKSPKKP